MRLFNLFIHKIILCHVINTSSLAPLMNRYCFARWRESASVVCCRLYRCRRTAGTRVVGGRHSTAGQYCYVPLRRHLVLICLYILFPISSIWITVVSKSVEFSVNGCYFGRRLKTGHVSNNFSINLIILVVFLYQKTYI